MYIKVEVTPNAKKETFLSIKENSFKISVKEKAENNAANKRVCEIVSKHFKNPEGGVKIINGVHHRIKLLKVGKD